MPRQLKIDHLLTVKTYPPDVEINFSYSNMEFLLKQDELPFTRESIQLHAFSGDARVGSRQLLNTLSRCSSEGTSRSIPCHEGLGETHSAPRGPSGWAEV